MRALLTIPHYYAVAAGSLHGSNRSAASARKRALELCITSLHETFGLNQGMYSVGQKKIHRFNQPTALELDIVICTHGDDHVLNQLGITDSLYRHHQASCSPGELGFECHAILRAQLGRYDYYGYLEDDIQIFDPLFFSKLRWFVQQAGQECLLQPNRFEASARFLVRKLYVDAVLRDPTIVARFQNRHDRTTLEYETLGRRWLFERPENPHSGCFFLDAAQMEHWTRQPCFLDRCVDFWGPLESAATLGIMRTFRLYKPAADSGSFLEVRHLDNRYLGKLLSVTPEILEP